MSGADRLAKCGVETQDPGEAAVQGRITAIMCKIKRPSQRSFGRAGAHGGGQILCCVGSEVL